MAVTFGHGLQRQVWRDIACGTTAELIEDMHCMAALDGLALERKIWQARCYGDAVLEYVAYEGQTRLFVAREKNRTVGIVRVFKGGPEVPPFLKLPISPHVLRERLLTGCANGCVEELATTAVEKNLVLAQVSNSLWRLAYLDALDRGVEIWGIIMEPWRARTLNRRYGFTFHQIGPEIAYQGGQCAAHIMDIAALGQQLSQVGPRTRDRLAYFVSGRPCDGANSLVGQPVGRMDDDGQGVLGAR